MGAGTLVTNLACVERTLPQASCGSFEVAVGTSQRAASWISAGK